MEPTLPTVGRIAGIDFGTVRIGIAITDPGRTIVSPYENYTRRGERLDAMRFADLVAEESVVGFVVGLPLHMSGDESQKSVEAREFGKWLSEVTDCPTTFWDERHTSVQAADFLQSHLTKKKRKARLDMLAAHIMLSAFVEAQARDYK